MHSVTSGTLAIIPAHNEEKSISSIVSSIKKLFPDLPVVVVNDGSEDATAKAVSGEGVIVLSHPFRMGYGAALQTGYKFAVRHNFQYIVQLDGDGQHNPEDIGLLLETLKDGFCDIVIGSRFLGVSNYKMSLFRLVGIKLFCFFIRLLSGNRISDPTSGFQAMNSNVLKIYIKDIFPCDYPDADTIILLSKFGINIKEVSVCMLPNKEGKSMHNNLINVFYYVFKMFLSMLVIKLTKFSNEQEI